MWLGISTYVDDGSPPFVRQWTETIEDTGYYSTNLGSQQVQTSKLGHTDDPCEPWQSSTGMCRLLQMTASHTALSLTTDLSPLIHPSHFALHDLLVRTS